MLTTSPDIRLRDYKGVFFLEAKSADGSYVEIHRYDPHPRGIRKSKDLNHDYRCLLCDVVMTSDKGAPESATREHVLPQWFIRRVRKFTTRKAHVKSVSDDPTKSKVPCCANCNNVILPKSLENSVLAAFEGGSDGLRSIDPVTLAHWALWIVIKMSYSDAQRGWITMSDFLDMHADDLWMVKSALVDEEPIISREMFSIGYFHTRDGAETFSEQMNVGKTFMFSAFGGAFVVCFDGGYSQNALSATSEYLRNVPLSAMQLMDIALTTAALGGQSRCVFGITDSRTLYPKKFVEHLPTDKPSTLDADFPLYYALYTSGIVNSLIVNPEGGVYLSDKDVTEAGTDYELNRTLSSILETKGWTVIASEVPGEAKPAILRMAIEVWENISYVTMFPDADTDVERIARHFLSSRFYEMRYSTPNRRIIEHHNRMYLPHFWGCQVREGGRIVVGLTSKEIYSLHLDEARSKTLDELEAAAIKAEHPPGWSPGRSMREYIRRR